MLGLTPDADGMGMPVSKRYGNGLSHAYGRGFSRYLRNAWVDPCHSHASG